jgi:hypothetical protein
LNWLLKRARKKGLEAARMVRWTSKTLLSADTSTASDGGKWSVAIGCSSFSDQSLLVLLSDIAAVVSSVDES